MNNERKSKNIVIGLLCAVIVLMGIGFASIFSDLEIKGGTSLSNTWNVQITNIEAVDTKGKANPGTPTRTATTANFNATLEEPGDAVTYEVTVTNNGSINAVLTTINKVFDNLDTDAIEYTLSEQNPVINAKLASGETHTFTVTATYKSTAIGENAPTEQEKTKAFSLQLKYEQDLTTTS